MQKLLVMFLHVVLMFSFELRYEVQREIILRRAAIARYYVFWLKSSINLGLKSDILKTEGDTVVGHTFCRKPLTSPLH